MTLSIFSVPEIVLWLPGSSRERGYKPGRFSFNVSGGRCEACQGEGQRRIEMNFLPDVYVLCEVCGGKRYNHETLAVKYKGQSIADLLEMPVSDALPILENIPQVRQKLQTLVDVGLGYIHLGQSAVTLSGGEEGGRIVAQGTPEQVARNKKSYTGQALAGYFSNGPREKSLA